MSNDQPPRRGVPQPLQGGPIRFGPYWLDARIAVGGTAEVYLARPTDARGEPRKLIVKRLLPHFANDEEGRTMFEREARLHAAVTHDNVVTVFGSGITDDGEPYLAMEYVDGCDAYRLLRRMSQERRQLPVSIAAHVGREVLRALASVHSAQDQSGIPLGIIHRDVTPSNLYLARDGRVKLGDFGIARSATRVSLRNTQSAILKGKFAYLSPEQVAGEPFDHRADLFSMSTVLSEMILGQPLFPGSGQLAVLLAIRDCRIDPLREAKDRLPSGLFEVLERALARDPRQRFQHAAAFAAALKPFDANPEASKKELGALVAWVQTASSTESMAAVRESARAMRAARPVAETIAREEPSTGAGKGTEKKTLEVAVDPDEHDRITGDYPQLPSHVVTANNAKYGPWTFARLVEAIATGTVGRGDQVDYMGRGLEKVETIEDLARFLPPSSVSTNDLTGPGTPDFSDNLATTSMLSILLRILEKHETGVLFVERAADERAVAGRKELYFMAGRLHHVASSNASELLGEYLVRRGKLAREELDLALAVLPRYGGRIGDTLISLGVVDAVDIFRAIRDQGRDKVTDLFLWREGKVSFYSDAAVPRVEFPLDLDLPALMISGLEAAEPADTPLETFFPRLDDMLLPELAVPAGLREIEWPPLVAKVLDATRVPRKLREVMTLAVRGGAATAGDVGRAVKLLLVAHVLRWGGSKG